MTIINLTPHAVTVLLQDGSGVEFPPSGETARLIMEEREGAPVNGLPTIHRQAIKIEGLTEPSEDVAGYIVSSIVLAAVEGRDDVFAPDTGPTAVRNGKGHIIAVKRLVRA